MSAFRIACIGECMIELSQRDGATLGLAYGGDTLNTAVYLARVGLARIGGRALLSVDYVTALGDDPYSNAMIEMWHGEAVGTKNVARLPGKLPGLYLIRVDDAGERRFFYYRTEAAARELFRDAATAGQLDALPGYDLLYFSAITLSILSETARDRFYAALQAARRAGRRIAFDSNYRPAGWPDAAAARRVVERFLGCVDIALPTFEDEQKLFGDASPAATAARYAASGVAETAVKLGAAGCEVSCDGERRLIPVPRQVVAIDTTAAGDAFNAGYLAARLAGHPVERAARAGHDLAGAVVQHRGAIIPRDAMPTLEL
jgi:2-dehydro-3-deoxygluconokinase